MSGDTENNGKSEFTRSRARSRRQSNRREAQNSASSHNQAEGKKKGKLWVKLLVFAIAECFALFFIFGYAYAVKQLNKIQRPLFNKENVVNSELSIEKVKEMEEGYWNVAVFGVDSRDSSVGKGTNSDVILVVSIDKSTGKINMVSVYRDTYLDTGYGKFNKINNAYAVGGPEQALKALNRDLDLNITDYVTFNWKAVATAINILGGVDVEISKAEFKYINSYITETVKGTDIGSVHLKAPGMNHLDGIQAVAYARLRYMDSDFERTERQRKIIQLAFDKVKQADLKTLNDLLGNMLSLVGTNMTWQDGLDLIARLDNYSIGETAGFPFTKGGANIRGKGVCVIPQNLTSNVVELHKLLFADEAYEVSKTVQEINYRIEVDSGRGYSGDGGGSGSKKKTTAAVTVEQTQETEEETQEYTTTHAESSTNSSGRPYETNRNGDIIWLDEEEDDESEVETDRPTDPSNRGPGITTSAGISASSVTDPTAKSSSGSSSSSSSSAASSSANTVQPSTGAGSQRTTSQAASSQAASTAPSETIPAAPTAPATTASAVTNAPEGPGVVQPRPVEPAPVEGENGGPGV